LTWVGWRLLRSFNVVFPARARLWSRTWREQQQPLEAGRQRCHVPLAACGRGCDRSVPPWLWPCWVFPFSGL